MALLTCRAILTPESHEDGEENRGRVVKQVTGSSGGTCRAEVPVITELVTQGAHGEGIVLVTHLSAVTDKGTGSSEYSSSETVDVQ